jgi:hypothetical protein
MQGSVPPLALVLVLARQAQVSEREPNWDRPAQPDMRKPPDMPEPADM